MSRSNSKRKNTKEAKKNVQNHNSEITGIIFIACGILSAVSIYTNLAGFLSTFSQKISHLLLGIGAYVVPIYLIYLGYNYLKGRGKINLDKKFYGITLFVGVIILFSGTFYVESLSDITFGKGMSNIIQTIVKADYGFNGGLVGHLISYPLFKILGFVGSFIVYIALIIIASILTFSISIFDLGERANVKRKEFKKRREISPTIKNDERNDFINVIEKEEKLEPNREEFLKGVNHKIKILDFMKNATIDDELEVAVENNTEKEISSFINSEEAMPSVKKEKLDNGIKESVNKEIEDILNEDKEEIEKKEYVFPNTELLNVNNKTKLNSSDKKELIDSANKLEETLGSFGVDAKVVQVTKGPSVTRFELQPSPGVKVSKIVNLSDDIALGLAASGVRIEAPIPGKAAVGIEVPNKKQTPVFLREVLDSKEFTSSNKKLAFALGKDIGGACVVGDLSKMPHTLIAGATGSGKSVCINSLIISLLYKYSPDEVKLLMVDPKVVELNVYNGIPHLLIPVVTDPKKAAAALNWAVNEMTKRYNLFAEMGVRNIDSYNALMDKGIIEEKLPYIVIIVDELADLMMVCPNDVEDYIGRLAQMARAAGMHLVIATQRPSVDVITGVIKANIPSRISFAVSSQVDSRTILDSAGAEKLLGKGDMRYYPVGQSKPQRVQGCFISEEEVEKVIEFIKSEEKDAVYEESILDHINNETEGKNIDSSDDADELLPEAINLVIEYEQASTSFLQRRLRVGFNRASRIMDQLEERGIISPKDGSRPRQVLMKKEDLLHNSDNMEEN